MPDPALELAQLINSTPEFTRRINDYSKAGKDAAAERDKADKAKAAAEDAQRALDRKLAEHRAAMAEATRAHDAAAAEAAKRIELAKKIEDGCRDREAAADKREKELSERESAVDLIKSQFERAINALGKL